MLAWPCVRLYSCSTINVILLYVWQSLSTSDTDCPSSGSVASLVVISRSPLVEFFLFPLFRRLSLTRFSAWQQYARNKRISVVPSGTRRRKQPFAILTTSSPHLPGHILSTALLSGLLTLSVLSIQEIFCFSVKCIFFPLDLSAQPIGHDVSRLRFIMTGPQTGKHSCLALNEGVEHS